MFVGKDINNPNVVGGVKNELPKLTGPDPFSTRCLSFKKWYSYARLTQSLLTSQSFYFQNAYLKHIELSTADHNQDFDNKCGYSN